MEFHFSQISLANLVIGDFNALWFSLLGMGIVFVGLVIISISIDLLPRLLEMGRARRPNAAPEAKESWGEEPEEVDAHVLLAIATAFHLDQDFPEDHAHMKWKSHCDVESPWRVSGRIHVQSTRGRVAAGRW